MSFDNKLFKLGRDLGAFTVLSTSTRNLDRDTDQPRVVCCGANNKIFSGDGILLSLHET